MDTDNWQCQVDEVIALEAICGEDFRVLSCSALPDAAELTGEALSTVTPGRPTDLHCELLVHVEVPEGGLQLLVEIDTGAAPSNSSADELAAGSSSQQDAAAMAGPGSSGRPDEPVTGGGSGAKAPAAGPSSNEDATKTNGGGSSAKAAAEGSSSNGAGAKAYGNSSKEGTAAGSSDHGDGTAANGGLGTTAGRQTDGGTAETQQPSSATPPSRMAFPIGTPVRYLPPITVQLQLPPDYPSTSAPVAALHAVWLSHAMLADLTSQLSVLWEQQGPGAPIVFTWQDWLHTCCLQHLGVKERLVLVDPALAPQGSGELNGAGTSRRQAVPADQVALGLLRYDAARDAEAFAAGRWLCAICFDEHPGSKCMRLPECGHYYCCGCLSEHCRSQVQEGKVDNLRCPTPSCRKHIPPYIVRELLTEEEFERWEQIVLQRTLDAMTDAAYCPRCSTLTLEEADHCAQCPKCLFVFCGLCLASWHPGEPCMDAEARLKLLEGRSTVGNQQQRERLIQEMLSLRVLKETSKPCPNCGMAISKTEGCNKMVCGNCHSYFCWRCGKQINGYDHFGSGNCVLFEQAQIDAWNAMVNNAERNEEVMLRRARFYVAIQFGGRLSRCPACGQENLKEGRNNSIRCWSCHSSYCHLCKVVLRGRGAVGAHYLSKGGCKQHSDD